MQLLPKCFPTFWYQENLKPWLFQASQVLVKLKPINNASGSSTFTISKLIRRLIIPLQWRRNSELRKRSRLATRSLKLSETVKPSEITILPALVSTFPSPFHKKRKKSSMPISTIIYSKSQESFLVLKINKTFTSFINLSPSFLFMINSSISLLMKTQKNWLSNTSII